MSYNTLFFCEILIIIICFTSISPNKVINNFKSFSEEETKINNYSSINLTIPETSKMWSPLSFFASPKNAEEKYEFEISLTSPMIIYPYKVSTTDEIEIIDGNAETYNFEGDNYEYINKLTANKIRHSFQINENSDNNKISYNDVIIYKYNNRKIDKKGSIGLCYSGSNFDLNGYEEENSFWNISLNNNITAKKIFSIDKHTPNEESLYQIMYNTTLYLGDIHEDFISNYSKGKVGEVDILVSEEWDDEKKEPKLPLWGFNLSEMYIDNNKTKIDLGENGTFYETYLFEGDKIVFPSKILNQTIERFSKQYDCIIDDYGYETLFKYPFIVCRNLSSNASTSIPISFVDTKNNMTITGIVDDIRFLERQHLNYNKSDFQTNIFFKDVNFTLLPINMFRNFHILFDGEEKKIKFYSNDTNILKVNYEKPIQNETNNEVKESGNGTIIIVVLVIITLLCLAGAFGLFYLKNKRKNGHNFEGKFKILEEDEEDFRQMNDNRVE